MSKTLFLDTNIYLHYQLFDQVNWLEVVGAHSAIIIIPPVTIRELNKHKDSHPRAHVKRRAGTVLKRLYELFGSGSAAQLKADIEVRLEDRDPRIDFAEYQLSYDIQDDHLIASIIMHRVEEPESDVVLITSDAGLLLEAKAKRHGIEAVKLADNFKLAEQPDLDKKRISELEQELRELKSRIPQLSLEFETGAPHTAFTLLPPISMSQEELQRKVEKIMERYPEMREKPMQPSKPSEKSIPGFPFSLPQLLQENTVASEDVAEYNSELPKFYQRYEEYLREDTNYQNLKRRTVILQIWLANGGTVPAEDIDIFMHFPDGFDLISEGKYPKASEEPAPPVKPKTPLQKRMELISGALSGPSLTPFDMIAPRTDFTPPNVSPPTITRTSSYDVEFHVRRLKHNFRASLRPLHVLFDSFDSAHPFGIDYQILAANVPHEISGRLHVVISRAPTEQDDSVP